MNPGGKFSPSKSQHINNNRPDLRQNSRIGTNTKPSQWDGGEVATLIVEKFKTMAAVRSLYDKEYMSDADKNSETFSCCHSFPTSPSKKRLRKDHEHVLRTSLNFG